MLNSWVSEFLANELEKQRNRKASFELYSTGARSREEHVAIMKANVQAPPWEPGRPETKTEADTEAIDYHELNSPTSFLNLRQHREQERAAMVQQIRVLWRAGEGARRIAEVVKGATPGLIREALRHARRSPPSHDPEKQEKRRQEKSARDIRNAEIRALYKNGSNYKDLAAQFELSKVAVRKICAK